jgi:hypothetical protein
MRKRIVIGLVALVIVAGIAALVFRPWESPVEYHKREYVAAWKRLKGQTFVDRAKRFFYQATTGRNRPAPGWSRGDGERVMFHRAELFALGYLRQESFYLTNCVASAMLSSPEFVSAQRRAQREFLSVTTQSGSIVRVIAVKEDMPMFVEAVDKAESGK